jgi:hypothetical protein
MKRQTHAAGGPTGPSPEVIGVRATTRGSFATEEIVRSTASTAFNQRVPPSHARRGTVMDPSQFGRGHKPCTGTESQCTEWQ